MAQQPATQPLRGQAAGSATRRPAPPRRRVVRRHVVVRRIDPWSVLKLSLIFYFFLLLVAMLGLVVLWGLVARLGVIDQTLAFLETLNFEVELNMGNIARALFLVGVLQVILLSGVNVFLTFLYNLVADLLGGLRVTLGEEERARDPQGSDGQVERAGEPASRAAQGPGLQQQPAGARPGAAGGGSRDRAAPPAAAERTRPADPRGGQRTEALRSRGRADDAAQGRRPLQ